MEILDISFFLKQGFYKATNRMYIYDIDFLKDSTVNIIDLENGTFKLRASNYAETRTIEGIISTKEELNQAMDWCKIKRFE